MKNLTYSDRQRDQAEKERKRGRDWGKGEGQEREREEEWQHKYQVGYIKYKNFKIDIFKDRSINLKLCQNPYV